jgi:hypothetical protein
MIIFGGVQIILSQIPDFNTLSWLSVVATVMSFSYGLIGLGLSVAKVAGNLFSFVNINLFCIRRLNICKTPVLNYVLYQEWFGACT